MKRILSTPSEIPPKDDKLTENVARCNPKVYVGKYDPIELEEWTRRMEKILTVVEELRVKFYLVVAQ